MTECPSFVNNKLGLHVDLYLSHDYAIQSLTDGGNAQSLLTMREESESTSYSYSIGARIGFTLPGGMGLKTGLNISKIRNNFSFNSNDGMDTIMVSNIVNATNTYTYVDIPFLFSYEMSGIGPFYYNVNAGILFNMTMTAEGSFVAPNETVVSFTRGAEDRFVAYRRDAGAALFASLGLHYVWSDVIDFVIEPNIKYGVRSISLSEYPLDEKYATVGLITGIRYKF